MSEAPIISTSTEGEILENYMDQTVMEPVVSYAEAKAAVKESFL